MFSMRMFAAANSVAAAEFDRRSSALPAKVPNDVFNRMIGQGNQAGRSENGEEQAAPKDLGSNHRAELFRFVVVIAEETQIEPVKSAANARRGAEPDHPEEGDAHADAERVLDGRAAEGSRFRLRPLIRVRRSVRVHHRDFSSACKRPVHSRSERRLWANGLPFVHNRAFDIMMLDRDFALFFLCRERDRKKTAFHSMKLVIGRIFSR